MRKEILRRPISGYGILALMFVLIGLTLGGFEYTGNKAFLLGLVPMTLLLPGFMIVGPNHSSVMTLFGKYVGTVKKNGFMWTNPFYHRKKVSLRARN